MFNYQFIKLIVKHLRARVYIYFFYFLASQIGNANIFYPALGYDDTKSDTINEIKAVKNGG